MEKKEILEKSQSKKIIVGEMEKSKISKCNWISIITSGLLAVTFMILFGALGNFAALYAIGSICFCWASVFYFCQYFVAKRPWQVLIGAVIDLIGFVIMFVFFFIFVI